MISDQEALAKLKKEFIDMMACEICGEDIPMEIESFSKIVYC